MSGMRNTRGRRVPAQPDLQPIWQATCDDHVVALRWSPTGQTLAAAAISGPISILESASGTVQHVLPGHPGPYRGMYEVSSQYLGEPALPQARSSAILSV
jgi:hypothetical protein